MRLRLSFTRRRSRPKLKPGRFKKNCQKWSVFKTIRFIGRVNGETASIWKRLRGAKLAGSRRVNMVNLARSAALACTVTFETWKTCKHFQTGKISHLPYEPMSIYRKTICDVMFDILSASWPLCWRLFSHRQLYSAACYTVATWQSFWLIFEKKLFGIFLTPF